ncbi:MAG TPA: tetratricopeptide repeat protein, partial [Ktedonobacteraceae bacterium]|nr:tetratricopeptide repeat protein [Ktedonobacteraceae bacterium]
VPWLIVKGVCDYADRRKDDRYHTYAARASALYALSFIQAYVTQERLPPPTGRAGPKPIRHIPYARNLHFTGRDAVLATLRQVLVPGAEVTAPTRAISGLGGVGKTQVALEYAHRYADAYTAVLWVQADSPENLTTEYLRLATDTLGLSEQPEAARQVEAVKRWLQDHERWLLILDNVENPQQILPAFLPGEHRGSVLITTRRRDVKAVARGEVLSVLSQEEGVLLLLRRAGSLGEQGGISEADPQEVVTATELYRLMEGLPLALDQAGAYIAENGCSMQRYLELYQQAQPRLLDRQTSPDHRDSVLKTFRLSWEAIKSKSLMASKALQCCAFVAPEQIPEPLVFAALKLAEPEKSSDALTMDEVLGWLHRYSLIERGNLLLSIHRLIQEVIRALLPEAERHQWMEWVVRAVNTHFPSGSYENWSECEQLLPHALVCERWIEQIWQRVPDEGARLLNKMGRYFYERAQYEEAEPLSQRALAIREQVLGPEHPATATSLNTLAALYWAQGKYEQAEPLSQRALAIREQVLGPEHPDTAISLNNLAGLYYHQGKYEEAEPLYRRVLGILTPSLGLEHSHTRQAKENYVMLLSQMHPGEDLETLLQRLFSEVPEQPMDQ